MLIKRIFALLVFALFNNSVYSQNIFPSFEDHPEWNVQRSIEPSLPGSVFIMSYHLEKDTVINKKNYFPVSRTGNQQPHLSYESVGFIRNDAKKVFFKKSAEGKEYLLYDFGLHVGETAYCPFFDADSAQYHVLAVDSVELNGVKHLRLKVRPEDYYVSGPFLMYWIEGIGNLGNPFYADVFGRSGFSDEVRCVSEDAVQLYSNPNYDDCTTVLRKTDCIVNEGFVWSGMNIYKDQSGKDSVASYHIKFEGDTILNDRTYTKIWYSNDSLGVNWNVAGLIREAEKRVYYHKLNDDGFYDMLLYDFSVQTGNSLSLASVESPSFFEQMWVTNVDSVEVNGEKKLRIEISTNGKYVDTWIEKIGSLQGILSRCYKGADAQKILLCVQENGKTIYTNPKYNTCFYTSLNDIPNPDKGFKVYPNPVSRELFIQQTSDIDEGFTLEIYSVKGELVKTECLDSGSSLHRIDTSLLRNGLYILRLISASGTYDEKVIVKER